MKRRRLRWVCPLQKGRRWKHGKVAPGKLRERERERKRERGLREAEEPTGNGEKEKKDKGDSVR